MAITVVTIAKSADDEYDDTLRALSEASVNRHTTTLPILLALALLGFVGSVSVARFTHGSDDIDAERP